MRRVRSSAGFWQEANGFPVCSARHAAVTRPCGPLARDGACRVGPSVRGGAGGGPQHASEADSAPKKMDSRCARRATRRSPRTSSRSCTCTDARKVGSVRTHPLGQPHTRQCARMAGDHVRTQNRNMSRSLDAGVFYRKMARRAHQVPHANKPTRIYATYGAPRLKYASRAMRSHPHPRAARASATRDTARTHMASDMAPPCHRKRPDTDDLPLHSIW